MSRKFKIGQEIEVCGVQFTVFYHSGRCVKCLARNESDFNIPDEEWKKIIRNGPSWNILKDVLSEFNERFMKDPVRKWMCRKGRDPKTLACSFRLPSAQEYIYYLCQSGGGADGVRFVTTDYIPKTKSVLVAGHRRVQEEHIDSVYLQILPICEFDAECLSDYLSAQEKMRREAKAEVDMVLRRYGFKEYEDLVKIAN